MADEFDFVDDLDDGDESPVSSPCRSMKAMTKLSSPLKHSSTSHYKKKDVDVDVEDGTKNVSSAAASEASVPEPVRTLCPVLKGSRHKRALLRKQQQQQQQEQQKQKRQKTIQQEQEKNGSSPDKHVRFSTELSKKSVNEANNNDEFDYDDEDWSSSMASSAATERRNLRRKRRRKPTVNTTTTSRPKSKLARPTDPTTHNDIGNTTGSAVLGDSSANLSPLGMRSDMMKWGGGHLNLSEQIKKQLQQHEKEQKKICPSPTREVVARRRVRGAARDVYAVQDAGNHQMIHDECTYITSTILACPKVKIPAKAAIIESVAELASLLACTKTRRLLWQGETASSSKQEHETLKDILDVIEHTSSALIDKETSLNSSNRWKALTQRLSLVNPKVSKGHGIATQAVEHSKHSSQTNIVEAYFTGLLLDALAAVVSFLSWDATIDNQVSVYHKNSSGARSLRQTILHHEGVLSAIVYILRQSDPIVKSILEEAVQGNAASSSTVASKEHSLDDVEQQSTRGLRGKKGKNETHANIHSLSQTSDLSSVRSGAMSAFSSSQADTETLNSAEATQDPTILGRRKRRGRHKGANLQMEPIAEDGSIDMAFHVSSATEPPRSPPRVVFEQPQEANDARTKLSFQDSLSRQSSPARREDGSSVVSCDSTLLTIHDQLGKARDKFPLPDRALRVGIKGQHECQGHRELPMSFGGKDPAGCSSFLALKALNRLLAGKDESEQHSCLDEDDGDGNRQKPHSGQLDRLDDLDDRVMVDSPNPQLEEDEILRSNPLLQTNRVLGDSGALASLAEGMADILTAIVQEVESNNACRACLQHLYGKLQGFAPIVDNACLLNEINRLELCSASTGSSELDDVHCHGGVLVSSQVLFLKVWLQQMALSPATKSVRNAMPLLSEIGLSVLSTMTSLTHDNDLAANQLAVLYRDVEGSNGPIAEQRNWSGVHLLGQILYQAATASAELNSKIAYDCRIFCLNALTNVVGEDRRGNVRRILTTMECPQADGARAVPFLIWLSQWLIAQTETFRDSILNGSFGSGRNRGSELHSDRELDKHENEQLVTAGNGCVLLACLLMGAPKDGTSDVDKGLKESTRNIREVILSEMPLDKRSGLPTGTLFIQNTLRAFSNYLYFSVGDLSVAVVAPVRKLISELDKIRVEVVA